MGMTLKQAFTQWANAPRNVVLAAKSRDAVQRVLMKKWNDIDLEVITPTFAERIFSQSSESKELKIKAASILVYLLQWGGDHGYCQRPTFDYTIANVLPKSVTAGDVPQNEKDSHVLPPSDIDPLAGINFDEPKDVADALLEQSARIMNDKPKEETNMENKEQSAAKKVVQIDAKSLEPIKIWDSACQVKREIGVGNIKRAIDNRSLSGGFFWCYAGSEKDFKPAEKKRNGRPSAPNSSAAKPKPVVNHPANAVTEKADITAFTDDELVAEIKRRGWKGTLSMTVNIDL